MSATKSTPPWRGIKDPVRLVSDYMKVTSVPSLTHERGGGRLSKKTLGIVNGSSWITLWSAWFGRTILPGVKLVQTGGDHVQLRFMKAHHAHEPCPPSDTIRSFARVAQELVRFYPVDAILITCSTMNRAVKTVRRVLKPTGVPVVQIDEAMMEAAVTRGSRILVIATHGPSVAATQALLKETAEQKGRTISFTGATVESAFGALGRGDVSRHNEEIARAIRSAQKRTKIDTVVLAQLSMSVFAFEHPQAEAEFGVPVLNSGECGFQRVRELLLKK